MRIEYYEVKETLRILSKWNDAINDAIDKEALSDDTKVMYLADIHKNAVKAVLDVNYILYGVESPLFLKEICDGLMTIHSWQNFYEHWENEVIATIAQRTSVPVVDADFLYLMDLISASSESQLIQRMIDHLAEIRYYDEEAYQNLKNYYTIYERMWGQIDLDSENISALKDRAFQLKQHQEDFFWLYQRLEDYRSKKVLVCILSYWLTYNVQHLNICRETNFSDYFDLDIIPVANNEVFVDAGAWRGDTVKEFIQVYGNYQKIYAFEITPESIASFEKELAKSENIELIPKALGSEKGTFYLKYYGQDHSSNSLSSTSGDLAVDVVSLDEEIREKITWIKMDIEGSEQAAILGAKRHIAQERPKLTICTYHNNEDIWKVPRMIDQIRKDYRFYLRYNGTQIGATEFVFFAV